MRVVALVLVDVVDPVPWEEPEDLVRLVLLRPPALPEGVHLGVVLLAGPRNIMLDPVTEVIIRARQVGRQWPQAQPVEEIASDKVEGQATGLALQLCEAVW